LSIEAWIELDARNNSDQELENLSFNPGNTFFSGIRNKVDVIEGGSIIKNIEYSYTTSMNNNHMHEIDSIDANGNGYTKPHQHTMPGMNKALMHRHQIVNGVVQVAGQKPHVHNIKPLTSIIDKRTKDLLASIPITPTVPNNFVTKKQTKNFFQTKTNNFSDVQSSFSPIWFSRGENLDNRIIFGINFKSLLMNNATLNGLLVKKINYEKFLKFAPPVVSSMEIFRKRIKGNTEVNESQKKQSNDQIIEPVFGNSNNTLIEKFENDNAEFPVCFVYGQRIDQPFSSISYGANSPFASCAGNYFSEIKMFNSSEFKFFNIHDKTMSGNRNGVYQYGVKLKIYDSSNLIFTTHLSSLKTYRMIIENYLNESLSNNFSEKSPFQNDAALKNDSYEKKQRNKNPPISTLTAPSSKDYDDFYKKGGKLFGKEQKTNKNLGFNNPDLQRGEMVVKNFNGKTNSFTRNFAKNNTFTPRNKPESIDGKLKSAISSYLEILSFYVEEEIDVKTELNKLTNFLSPFAGSPETITDVITMFSELEKKIESLSSIYKKSMEKNSSTTSLSRKPKSHVGAGTRNKSPIFEVEYVFKDTYDSNVPKGVGMDFMSLGDNNSSGIKTINKARFFEVMDFENKKTFKNDSADVSIDGFTNGDTSERTKYSYVTPNTIKINPSINLKPSMNMRDIKMGDKETYKNIATITAMSNLGKSTRTKTSALIDFSTDKIQSDKIKNTFKNLQKPITRKDKTALEDGKTLDNQIKISNKVSEFFATNMGIRVVNASTKSTNKNDKPNETSVATEEDKTKSYVLNDLGNGKTSEANRAATGILNNLLKSADKKNNFKVQDYDLTSGDSKVRNRAEKFENPKTSVTQELSNAPNQIKAMFKLNERSTGPEDTFILNKETKEILEQDVTEDNRDTFRFRFETIQKIEVLVGFGNKVVKNKNQNPSISSEIAIPNWTILTKEIVDNIDERLLLCRLVPYESKLFNIKRDKKFDLPIYDQYFLISKD
jgi:hypothetical protein